MNVQLPLLKKGGVRLMDITTACAILGTAATIVGVIYQIWTQTSPRKKRTAAGKKQSLSNIKKPSQIMPKQSEDDMMATPSLDQAEI
jgi:hypothetical protein